MAGILALMVVAGVITLGSILNGWALSILWGWFFVPILGLPPLGIPQAIGISIVVSFLTHQYQRNTGKDENTGGALAYAFIQPIFALIIGYIVKSFM